MHAIYSDEVVFVTPSTKPRPISVIHVGINLLIYPIYYIDGYLPIVEVIFCNIDQLTSTIFLKFEDTDDQIECYLDYDKKVMYGEVNNGITHLFVRNNIYSGMYVNINYIRDNIFSINKIKKDKPTTVILKEFLCDDEYNWRASMRSLEVDYKCDPYIFSYGNSIIDNYAARKYEAEKAKYGLLTIIYKEMNNLTLINKRVHWSILYHNVFAIKTCSHNSVISILSNSANNCFKNLGNGYWAFDPRNRARPKSIRFKKKKKIPDYNREIAAKYLISGPAPFGRIVNYLVRIRRGEFEKIERGHVKNMDNLDKWCVNMMIGLSLVYKDNNKYKINRKIENTIKEISNIIYPLEEKRGRNESLKLAKHLMVAMPTFMKIITEIMKNSAAMYNLRVYFIRNKYNIVAKDKLYCSYGKIFGINKAHYNRLPCLLTTAEICGIIRQEVKNVIAIWTAIDI